MDKETAQNIVTIFCGMVIIISLIGYFPILGNDNSIFANVVNKSIKVIKEDSSTNKLLKIRDIIEKEASNVSLKLFFLDLNTAVNMIQGKKIISDASYDVVKLNNGYLTFLTKKINVDKSILNMLDLQNKMNDLQIKLLYVSAPQKISKYDKQLPYDLEDFGNENVDSFLEGISGRVKYMDLREEMYQENIDQYQYFFKTDHHWTPEGAFYSFGKIATILNAEYEFNIPQSYWELENYYVDNYEEYFLGSQGRRVGTLWTGVDDISLIYPRFKTDFLYEIPEMSILKKGEFSETMFEYSQIEKKDYYNKNPYAVYTGGDFPLTIITNEMPINNKKVLLVRDSYSCVLAPFLALGCNQLDIIDLRYYKEESLETYIEKTRPDIVIILYNPSSIGGEMMNFK